MKSQRVTLPEAVKDLSRGQKIFLGTAIATLLGVFTPILCLNIFGVWPNAYGAIGDHLFVGSACVLGNLLGVVTKRVWPSVVAFLIVLVGIQFFLLVKAKPVDDWWSAYPAFTRTVGGLVIDGLFFSWYARQTELITRARRSSKDGPIDIEPQPVPSAEVEHAEESALV